MLASIVNEVCYLSLSFSRFVLERGADGKMHFSFTRSVRPILDESLPDNSSDGNDVPCTLTDATVVGHGVSSTKLREKNPKWTSPSREFRRGQPAKVSIKGGRSSVDCVDEA